MDPVAHLALATAAFVGTHLVSGTRLRGALVGSLGEGPYRGLYSLVALATLGWMIWAYVNAPRETLLWTPLRLLPSLVMPFAFILVACGYARNPTAVGGDALLRSEEPGRGIIRITRHPIMWALILWSGAHIAARADPKSIVFFGGFLLVALLGTVSLDRRKARSAGEDWRRFAAVTSHIPFVAVAQRRNRIVWREIGWLRPLGGIAAFFLFFFLHPWLFGARAF
jgi:uncharacterized membrane protein